MTKQARILAGMSAFALVATFATAALAIDIYINDVLVTGVRDQHLQNVEVRFDGSGNVRITAPHYRIQRVDDQAAGDGGPEASTAPTAATVPSPTTSSVGALAGRQDPPANGGQGLTRRYWLVAECSSPGQVQYRFRVEINGRTVGSFDDATPPAPLEVTAYLQQGNNTVRLRADKVVEGGRRSTSSRDWLRVMVADGHIDGSAVVIDNPGVVATRTAAQTAPLSESFTLVAQ